MAIDFTVKWVDLGREPKCPPDPDYPSGIDIDMSEGAVNCCQTDLQYPAPRCGYHVVECNMCGSKAAITTAGRPDDPRSLKLPCRKGVH